MIPINVEFKEYILVSLELTNKNSVKVPKVFEPTNKKT